jgi:hypothetical protein
VRQATAVCAVKSRNVKPYLKFQVSRLSYIFGFSAKATKAVLEAEPQATTETTHRTNLKHIPDIGMEKVTYSSELQQLYYASASKMIRLRRISLTEYAARMGEMGNAYRL